MPSRAVIEHQIRLCVLSCILDSHPIAVFQLSNTLELREALVRHHLRVLDAAGIIKRLHQGLKSFYVVRRHELPDWVVDLVKDYRRSTGLDAA